MHSNFMGANNDEQDCRQPCNFIDVEINDLYTQHSFQEALLCDALQNNYILRPFINKRHL